MWNSGKTNILGNTSICEEIYNEERSSSSSENETVNNKSTNESLIQRRKHRLKKLKNKVTIWEKPNEWYEGEVDKLYSRQGYGVYSFCSGDVYEGEFDQGVRSGHGDYFFADGSRYTGEWLIDTKNGFGSYKFGTYEFYGQWEGDNFKSGFAIKINTEDKDILCTIDREDELDSESHSYKGISYTGSLVSSPQHPTRKNSAHKDEEDTRQVKIFIDKIEKKISTLNKYSSHLDVDLINFKSNTGDINVIKSFLKTEVSLVKKGIHTQNNSLMKFELTNITPIMSRSVSKVNSKNNSECQISQFNLNPRSNTKSQITNLHSSNLFKDTEFKCNMCLSGKNSVSFAWKCQCKNINDYVKTYKLEHNE